jgi:hypothetical protein
MNWLSVIQSVGVIAAVSGLLMWLIKSLISQSLSRDIETFKANLQRELEQARNRYAVDLEEFKVNLQLRVEQARNSLAVGATSHMANVAFDKHVEFCEKYVAEMNLTLTTLHMEGPSQKASEHAGSLQKIRVTHTLWLSTEIQGRLAKLEFALRAIGVYERHVNNYVSADGRSERIKELFTVFMKVIGEAEWEGKVLPQETAIPTMIESLRKVLGITELTELRSTLIGRAVSQLKD